MSIYRRIYEQNYGPIPKGHHIHHIDGDHSNNHIDNLQCVSPQEHFDIHKKQGDYGACWAMYITGHLTLSLEERSEISSKCAKSTTKKLLELGVHNFQTDHPAKRLVKEGKHHFQNKEFQSLQGTKSAKKQLSQGTHPFQTREINPNEIIVTCPHCSRSGAKPGMKRWHFDNCKNKGRSK